MKTVKELFSLQQNYVDNHLEPNLNLLKRQLIKLKENIISHEEKLYEAFYLDFHKSRQEVYLTEYAQVLNELNWFIKHLKQIHHKKQHFDPLWIINHRTFTIRQGYGTTLIYSPYNYPFNLAMIPLIASIALNNTVMLKLASYTKNVNAVIASILEKTFSIEQCCIVNENNSNNLYEDLYALNPGMVFFTGSEEIGKKIYENYSSKLVPVVLELGGKCPTIIDDSIDLDLVAKRLIWGKMINNGQTCICPDYLIVKEELKSQVVERLIKEFNKQYPKSKLGEDIAYSVNKKSIAKFNELLIGQKILAQLKTNDNQLGLTLVDVTKDDLNKPLMHTEIFGPIFPICTYKTKSDILDIVKMNDYPLATYVFSKDKNFIKWVFYNIKTGAVVNNDVLIHFTKNAPFGGIKNSGVGQYHKWSSVNAFSQLKTFVKTSKMDLSPRYAPYTEKKYKFMKKFYK